MVENNCIYCFSRIGTLGAMATYTCELFKVCINDDRGLNLTYSMTRSNLVAYAIECGKLFQSHGIGKTCCK